MDIIDTIVSRWVEQNIPINPGKSQKEIASLFLSLGQNATNDVISVYLKFDGMLEMEDDACLRIWSLSEIYERNDELSPYGILFADHLMDSWAYRIKSETQSNSSVYIDYFDSKKVPQKIFNSLVEFFCAYANNPSAILGNSH